MAEKFAGYGSLAKTDSYDDENAGASVTPKPAASARRYVGAFAVLLAVVGTVLLVVSTQSTTPARTQSKGVTFEAALDSTAPKVTDFHKTSSHKLSLIHI